MSERKNIGAKWSGLDLDSSISNIGTEGMGSFPGAYVDGWHFVLYAGKDGKAGVPRKFRGTRKIPWDKPATGTNTCIGTYWDESGNTMIAWIHNSDGQHSLLWHHPTEASARTIRMPAMNLSLGNPVTGCALVNNDLLVFVDGMDGDYPKCVNLPRADSFDKKSIVRMYVPRSSVLVDSRDFTGYLTLDGVQSGIAFGISVASTAQVYDYNPMFQLYADQWNANGLLRAKFEAVAHVDYVEFIAQQPGMWSIGATMIDTIGGFPQAQFPLVVEYWNRYNLPPLPYTGGLTTQQVRLAMVKPLLAPNAPTRLDTSIPASQIAGKVWQFAYGYRFKDKQRSLTSDISDIAVPSSGTCGATAPPNTVDISFAADRWLNDPAMRGEIEFVDIYAREGNDGSWIWAKSMSKPEWMYSRSWGFRNDIAAPAADQDFVEASFTSIPERANALEVITDSESGGNTRVNLGGIKEGHPTPSIDLEAHVELEGDSISPVAKGAIVGNIKIINFDASINFNFQRSQPIWKLDNNGKTIYGGLDNNLHSTDQEDLGQWFGKDAQGWAIYAEGTDYATMSVQNIFTTTTGQSPDTIAGTNVYDGTSVGRRDKIRLGISQAPPGSLVYSRFALTGLEAGRTYVIRMADNRCGFYSSGTDPESGSIYDLNSVGRKFQGTSSNCFLLGTATGNPNIIKTDTFEAIVKIPITGGTIDIGDILVADACKPGLGTNNWLHKVWVRDNDGLDNTLTDDIRTAGYPAEMQEVNYDILVPVPGPLYPPEWEYMRRMIYDGKVWTDHNGHAFFFSTEAAPTAAWISAGPTICNDYSASKWEGPLDTVAPLVAAPNPLDDSNKLSEYFFANLDNNAQGRIRTHVVCTFLDLAGSPIQGVLAILESGGSVLSDSVGKIRIPAYVDMETNNNDRIGILVVESGVSCSMTFPTNGLPVNIYQYSYNGVYSELYDYVIPTQSVMVFGQAPQLCFSRGGVYPVGYYLEQADGSRTPVKWCGDLRFPQLGQDLHTFNPLLYPVGTFSRGVGLIKWTISDSVPIPWAGRWVKLQWVVGPDGTRDFQLQWIGGRTVYASEWDEAQSIPVNVGYDSGQASEIYISLTDSLVRYQQVHTDSMLGYLWQQGDRLRLLSDRFGNPYQQVIDVAIGGQRNGSPTGQNGKWIVITYSSAIPHLFGGESFEIYRPRKTSLGTGRQVFYDIPSGSVEIVDPYGAAPSWAATNGTIRKGDTWLLPTLVPNRLTDTSLWNTKRMTRESKSASDFYPSQSWGRGKPAFMNADAATEERGGLMRFSDAYKPGTSINGLNFFDGPSYRIVENWLGRIMVMKRSENVIVAVCENGAFAIYVGVEQQQTLPDSQLITTGGILGNVRPFAFRFGTRHRQSVIQSGTSMFWFCADHGLLVYYNSNQLQDVSGQNNASTFFKALGASVPPSARVCAGWDMVHGEILVNFPAHTDETGEAEAAVPAVGIKYHDARNAFTAKMAFAPDAWGMAKQRLFSFAGGDLWEHHVTEEWNDIYGVRRPMRLSTPFLPDGTWIILTWKAIHARFRGIGWSVPKAWNIEGQETNMDSGRFILKEGWHTAAMRRDINTADPNVTDPVNEGDQMRANELVVELMNDGDKYAELLALNAEINVSPVTP